MKKSLGDKGQKKEIIDIFNDRIIDWIDENPGVKVLPEIVDVENNNFTFVVGIFKEIKPTVKVIPIRTDSGMTIRTDVVFETPNYKNISLLKECIEFLGDYFNYLVIEDSPIEEILSVKKFDVIEINNFLWQKVKYRFVKKENSMKNIKTYEDFVNEEINLRKGLIGVALGASLLGGMTSCNKEDIKPNVEQNISSNIFIGTWTTSFSYNTQYYTQNFSCKITFKENGEYWISERLTDGTSYPGLVKGRYKIIDNYATYCINNYGDDHGYSNDVKVLVLYNNNTNESMNHFRIEEIEGGYRYNLIREPNCQNLQELIGVQSPTSISSISVPDLSITKVL